MQDEEEERNVRKRFSLRSKTLIELDTGNRKEQTKKKGKEK